MFAHLDNARFRGAVSAGLLLFFATAGPELRALAEASNSNGGVPPVKSTNGLETLQASFRCWHTNLTEISARIKESGVTTNDLPEISRMIEEIKKKNEDIGGAPFDNLPPHKCAEVRSVGDRIISHLERAAENLKEFSECKINPVMGKIALMQLHGNLSKARTDLNGQTTQ